MTEAAEDTRPSPAGAMEAAGAERPTEAVWGSEGRLTDPECDPEAAARTGRRAEPETGGREAARSRLQADGQDEVA
jgi:hypothetical protein